MAVLLLQSCLLTVVTPFPGGAAATSWCRGTVGNGLYHGDSAEPKPDPIGSGTAGFYGLRHEHYVFISLGPSQTTRVVHCWYRGCLAESRFFQVLRLSQLPGGIPGLLIT